MTYMTYMTYVRWILLWILPCKYMQSRGDQEVSCGLIQIKTNQAGPQNEFVQAIDKVAPFFKKCLYLVASKLSLEVVPFWKTQANSGDHSATMFLSVFVFFSCVHLGFRYLVMLWVYVVFVAFSFFCCSCFLITDFCTFNCI